MTPFGDRIARMDARVMRLLNSGTAEYRPPGGLPPVRCIDVIIDENLMQNGPEGMFPTEAVGVTWRKCQLYDVERLGVFVVTSGHYAGRRFIVETKITDDGHMATTACMEDK